MPDLILHHFERSPYSEKVRLAFGLKRLAWTSVLIPRTLPKPDLMPLTGGYRRTPVMQIGADIYCDSLLILREIERRHPSPSLYPQGSEALVNALAWWADKTMLFPAVGLAGSFMDFPPEFIADRKALTGADFSRESMRARRPLNRQRLHAHLTWVHMMLADGRDFMLGSAPSAADFAAYHPIWSVGQNAGAEGQALLPLEPLRPWIDRIAAIGHGIRSDIEPQVALDIAQRATPQPPHPAADGDPTGLKAGIPVTVAADDYGTDPIAGTLVAADAHEVVIRREDVRVGQVNVHFPRAGFVVLPRD